MAALITLCAFGLDWILGDPGAWPHPVRLIGQAIDRGEKAARRWAGESPERLRRAGTILALAIVLAGMAAAYALLALAAHLAYFLLVAAALYLVYSALCLKELYRQTIIVEELIGRGDLPEARRRLSWVVGRDTENLDEAAVRRALIETVAENLSDGLVAPMFYLALGGPVLAWGYKAVNTLDSMIGYKNERFLDLGRFAAKLDDAAGFIPARLSAILIILSARLTGRDWRGAAKVWRRDGHLHASPNAGQPEAAMAGALGLRLGGPSSYGGLRHHKPYINEDGGEPGPPEVRAAEGLMLVAATLTLGLALFAIRFFTGGLWRL